MPADLKAGNVSYDTDIDFPKISLNFVSRLVYNTAMFTTKGNQMETVTNPVNEDYWKAENGRIQSQLMELVDAVYEDNTMDAKYVASQICDIIDYQPKKTIDFTATIRFRGQIEVDANDDYDLEDILGEAYVDINHGDVVIENYQLEDADEC